MSNMINDHCNRSAENAKDNHTNYNNQTDGDAITASDYIESQLRSEKQAREIMPYSPDSCSYKLGPIRQEVYACLTCSQKTGKPCGVCYACSVKCHSTHHLVELFTKRRFVCDCGTSRTSCIGRCKAEVHGAKSDSPLIDLKVKSNEDTKPDLRIASLSNTYNQNYKGLFCSCHRPYNPMDNSSMFQCQFGVVCGEDWYHDECLMGLKPGSVDRRPPSSGKNRIDELSEPGTDAESDNKAKTDDNGIIPLPGFPSLDDFDTIICWKCVSKFQNQFDRLAELLNCQKVYHIESNNLEQRSKLLAGIDDDDDMPSKKRQHTQNIPYSILLKKNFKQEITKIVRENKPENASLVKLMVEFPFMYKEDPIYRPPEDTDDEDSSIFEMGIKELNKVPVEQAITGMEAYNQIKSKLTQFLKPFADNNRIVTKDEVKKFFTNQISKK